MDIKSILKMESGNTWDTKIIHFFEGVISNENLNCEDDIIKGMLGDFLGKYGEIQSFRTLGKNENIVVIGIGKEEEFTIERARKAQAKAIKECKKLKAKLIRVYPGYAANNVSYCDYARAIVEASILTDYRYEKYKANKEASKISEIHIVCENADIMNEIDMGITEGKILGDATIFARDLVNEPANHLTPIELANQVKNAGEEYGFEVEVYDEFKIKELGMEAFMEVAKGSENPPRFIVMRYLKDMDNKDEIIGLVGKGLTYDSGGYAIKTLAGMVTMKGNMGGSAAVIGAMCAISKMKLKANVVAVVAACENMISGGAYKNGDVIGSMAGKTIEIMSTDAEGRLTLIDAVNYVIENEGAKKVVDIATLTGAVVVALGKDVTGVISNDEEFYLKLEGASRITGEKIWRLPTFPEYKELFKSEIADLKNSGGRFAGAIVAGLFIGEFVKERPWIHMDIAGTSDSEREFDYITKGGTGAGVRSLYQLIKDMSS